MQRRNFLRTTTGLAIAGPLGMPAIAGTGSFPSRPVTMIVPFPPGGATDVAARTMAEKMAPLLGQPVIVDNKPGAQTAIGADAAARAEPDG
ncbi:tripartite tricarboxylate transporter substrate-binding protein, partial [Escherichia coli]|uniref:tripartite tricarboxylate transporter substrate-binding protein n=1 Tax=Escherichia coli TaxID=562 RepID=UPI0012CF1377